ncbi:hypothetical protein F5890DRAFT_1479415 [Lentinula detonsa]|uniref:Uncharacterized protein n=1 Tax=Lentinula detonsa TaxID=2804962 RepID=A0AA38PMW7_9AGAR|nr:hypothetical protein F5890DRAFT_1479415 [Lentinula detonsa]
MRRKEEAKRREEARLLEEATAQEEDEQESTTALAKLIEENKREKEKAAKYLEKRREPGRKIARPRAEVIIPPRASSSKTKTFKSKSIISDESDVGEVDKEQAEPLRGVKRKRTIKMIAKNDNFPDPDGDFDAREGNDDDEEEDEPPSPSQQQPACTARDPLFHSCKRLGNILSSVKYYEIYLILGGLFRPKKAPKNA